MVAKFESRFYNSVTRERVIKKLHAVRVESCRTSNDKDDNEALKKLVTEIDRLCGMVLEHDRSPHARKRYLNSAVLGTEWAHHARSKVRSTEDICVMIEYLHESIDYLGSLKSNKSVHSSELIANRPSSVLFGDMDLDTQSDDDDEADDTTDSVKFQ